MFACVGSESLTIKLKRSTRIDVPLPPPRSRKRKTRTKFDKRDKNPRRIGTNNQRLPSSRNTVSSSEEPIFPMSNPRMMLSYYSAKKTPKPKHRHATSSASEYMHVGAAREHAASASTQKRSLSPETTDTAIGVSPTSSSAERSAASEPSSERVVNSGKRVKQTPTPDINMTRSNEQPVENHVNPVKRSKQSSHMPNVAVTNSRMVDIKRAHLADVTTDSSCMADMTSSRASDMKRARMADAPSSRTADATPSCTTDMKRARMTNVVSTRMETTDGDENVNAGASSLLHLRVSSHLHTAAAAALSSRSRGGGSGLHVPLASIAPPRPQQRVNSPPAPAAAEGATKFSAMRLRSLSPMPDALSHSSGGVEAAQHLMPCATVVPETKRADAGESLAVFSACYLTSLRFTMPAVGELPLSFRIQK